MREDGEKERRGLGPGYLLTSPKSTNRGGGLELLRRAFLPAWGHGSERGKRGMREEEQGF